MNTGFTRQQLITLGVLLLAGYLVFCGFGYFVGAGTAGTRELVAAGKVQRETAEPSEADYIATVEAALSDVRALTGNVSAVLALGEVEAGCRDVPLLQKRVGEARATMDLLTPPGRWRAWHFETCQQLEFMTAGLEHLEAGCKAFEDGDSELANAELAQFLGSRDGWMGQFDHTTRPWAAGGEVQRETVKPTLVLADTPNAHQYTGAYRHSHTAGYINKSIS